MDTPDELIESVKALADASTRIADKYTATTPKTFWKHLEPFKVPFTTIAVTTLLSVWLVPKITGRSAEEKLIKDTKVQKSLEVVRHAIADSARLNEIATAFEIYEKEALNLSDVAQLSERRGQLKKRVDDLYGTFNSEGWWWHQELVMQAAIMKLVPETTGKDLKEAAMQYAKNLETTVGMFQEARNRHLAGKDESAPSQVAPVMLDQREAFLRLHHERMKIVTTMITALN